MIEFKLKPTFATVDSCFDLVRSHQYGTERHEVFSWSTDIHTLTKMVMTSDETQIQIPDNWPMSHAKRVTRDNCKNPEYHVIAALRNLRTDTNCPAGKSWPNHVKNEQHIDLKKPTTILISECMDISRPAENFIACYTVLMRPNKVETAVYGCKCWLQFELYHAIAPLSF